MQLLWIPNLLGILGMLALAIPTMATDRLAGRVARIDEAARHEQTDEFFKELRAEVLSEGQANAWRPLYRVLLYGGYGALLLSSILRLIIQSQ